MNSILKGILWIFLVSSPSLAAAKALPPMIGVLLQEQSSDQAKVKPLFVLENRVWRLVDCKKEFAKGWKLLDDGKEGPSFSLSKTNSGDCKLAVSSQDSKKLPRIQLKDGAGLKSFVVATQEVHAEDPDQWKTYKLTEQDRKKLKFGAKVDILQSYRSKKGDLFIRASDWTGVHDGPATVIAGFWNSHFKKAWSSELSIVNFLGAGDYEKKGHSDIVIETGEFGGGGGFLLFSNDLKIIANSDP